MAILGEEGEQVVGRRRPEPLTRLERQLEHPSPDVGQEDVDVVRVEAGLFRSSIEEERGMVDDVLVHGRGRGDEDGDARAPAPSGPPELLPGGRHGARISGQDRRVQASDVDAELERVGGDDAEDLAVAKAALDRSSLRWQVAAPIAADPRSRPEPLAERLAKSGEEDLDCRPRPAEDDRLAARAEEWEGPPIGERDRRAASAGRAI